MAIERGCIAVITHCCPDKYIGRGCYVLQRARVGQTILNLSKGTSKLAVEGDWFVDLNCYSGHRLVGCINESGLLRIDDYSMKDLHRDHIMRMREHIANSKERRSKK